MERSDGAYVWVDGRTRGVPYVPGSGEALTPEDNNAEAYQEIVEQEDTPAYRGISPGQAPTGVVAQDTIRNVYLRGEDLSAEGVKDDQHIPVDVGEKDHFTHPLAYVEDLPTLYVDIKVGDRIRHAIPRGAMGIYHNEWSGAETGRYEYLSGAVSKQLQIGSIHACVFTRCTAAMYGSSSERSPTGRVSSSFFLVTVSRDGIRSSSD